MTRPVIYAIEASPSCHAVRLTAAALKIELDVRIISLKRKDHRKEEFIQMNPAHTVPTLVEDGFILWDSHAIMCYLSNKYAKDDSLYPKDLQLRAKVDQFLQFDNGHLFSSFVSIARPIFLFGDTNAPEEKIQKINNAYDVLEKLLEGRNWLVGDCYTLADISCVSTMSAYTALRPLDNYPNIQAWTKRCEETIPGYAEQSEPANKITHAAIRRNMPADLFF
ncbi:glutathione S-transferase 1-like [Belonocnema kinseyi]|uniref:glutathione S-transferase 1-like n=1 Tax=Belonocnema kinseyi TaxID=2817044 RepID=UPI00143DAC25|nr:glutathione S-transferase 1-like [Belonocnema kinseyi]